MPTKRRPSAASVLRAAEKVEDPAKRADLIEAGFAKVATPEALVKPWFAVRLEVAGNREATAARAVELASELCEVKLLDALGTELSRRAMPEQAIEVFEMALSAGSKAPFTRMLLGFELARRGDARGVPHLEASLAFNAEWSLPRKTLAAWWLERDPARAIATIGIALDGKEHELRAIASEKIGRADAAARESAAALARYDDELVARNELAEWHLDYKRPARALMHARALLALRTAREDVDDADDIDETIVHAFDESGCFAELLPWLQAREGAFPLRLGFRIYCALNGIVPDPDPAMHRKAARDVAAAYREKQDFAEARLWTVREAGVAADAGDLAPLDALVATDLEDDADAWAEVASAYIGIDQYDAASAAADRALIIDASCGSALVVCWRIAFHFGDSDTLHRVAMALVANQPYWHQGPEMLARSFARRLDARAALMHSERALAMSPYCHNAWTARAEALAVDGDIEGARTHIERSLVMQQHDNEGSDALILAAALAQDHEKLDAEIAKREKDAPAFARYYAYLKKLADR